MINYSKTGLTTAEVKQNRSKHGCNIITPAKDTSVLKLFLEKFRDPIIMILLLAAVLSLIVAFIEHSFTESIGIISAIILATGVGFAFEMDARRRFKRLNRTTDDTPVKVMRNGVMTTIPQHDVVVGDVVYIESGDMIPADGEAVEAVSLAVNESTLTGELEVDKTTSEADFDSEATYPSNALMRGTSVVDGYGVMVVTAVGDATEAGHVTQQATIESGEQTPLNRQLTTLSRVIGKVGIVLSVSIFIILMVKAFAFNSLWTSDWVAISHTVINAFMISVAVIVMAVPEGLPMSITLSLAMSMRRMLKTNNLVRKMHACETMGAVTVICTDKTGTLTQNRMVVKEVSRYGTASDKLLATVIAANSTAFIDADSNVIGNPTEGALLHHLGKHNFEYQALRDQVEIIDRLTFSTERKYMATIIQDRTTHERLLCVKGAPEIVYAACANSDACADVESQLASYQSRAMRTLGVAYATTASDNCAEAMQSSALQLIAIVAIEDPVRDDVPAAVGRCLGAGINIKIVTGDTTATACEIARQIGLWNAEIDGERNRMTGTEFAELSDEELLERIADLKVMSRARPLDKQRLVRLLQQRGEVVAVTGDGTNDAPALNFANVGLSMGSGTSVAKEAGDITLLDDSFASIATAVMWGRSLYRNIQRFVLFQLTINFAAIAICIFGALFGHDMPLTVVQILWVNLIMDTFAAMAMASLPPAPEVMNDKPRPHDEPIITRPMRRAILTGGTTFIIILIGMLIYWTRGGADATIGQLTIFFTTFVFLQIWNMFNAKGFASRHSAFADLWHCRTFVLILLGIAVGQAVIVEIGGEVFRTTHIHLHDWVIIIGATSLIAIGGDLIRRIAR